MKHDFLAVKNELIRLIGHFDLRLPNIDPALDSDECDFTDPPNLIIRIKPQDADPVYHARHVFGHYLADQHLVKGMADSVADIIAEMAGLI